jgi:hypothetical protein
MLPDSTYVTKLLACEPPKRDNSTCGSCLVRFNRIPGIGGCICFPIFSDDSGHLWGLKSVVRTLRPVLTLFQEAIQLVPRMRQRTIHLGALMIRPLAIYPVSWKG